ncbi:MAG: riboflavin synthase [Gemmatimonadetes bacterium]|nr:riboflavin synthase [Gemmatimonadota bacterium]
MAPRGGAAAPWIGPLGSPRAGGVMFTGIVETTGEVTEVEEADALRRIRVRVPGSFLEGVALGASISVDGACLTAVEVAPTEFVAEVIGTTLSRTIAPTYRTGTRVNLEKSVKLGERIDGHLVQGHIDGIGNVTKVKRDGSLHLIEVVVPLEVHRLTLTHGSISLNGVSLTVNRLLADGGVEVGIIPHTGSITNLGKLEVGDVVNVEGDLIGKYVGTLLRTELGRAGPREGSEEL